MRLLVRTGIGHLIRSENYSKIHGVRMMSEFTHPRIGVGVFVLRSSHGPTSTEFIMGRRLGSVGAGTLALPGGHLEFGESFEECAQREVYEETGLQVHNLRFITATNDVMKTEQKHYVTIFMVAERVGDEEPRVMEPDKCESWQWVGWDTLQRYARVQAALLEQKETEHEDARKLFSPLVALIQQRPNIIPSLK